MHCAWPGPHNPFPETESMEILYLLIPLSIVLVFFIVAIFWWTVKSGQLDDLEGPAHRIILDDDRTHPEYEKTRQNN